MNEYTYAEIQEGMSVSFQKQITSEMEEAFRTITGDCNPLHSDDGFAQEINPGKFRGHVAFGLLTASLLSTLGGVYLPGKYSLIHSIDNLSFKKPVYAGDVLTVTGTVDEKMDGLNLILVKVKIVNQDGATVLTAGMKILVQR